MMFITATAEWLAHKNGKQLCYPNAKEQFEHISTSFKWTEHAEEYNSIFKYIDWFKNQDMRGHIRDVVQIPFRYIEFSPKDGTEYRGYFQSERNFDGDFARELFTPTNRVTDEVNKYQALYNEGSATSIHVRRGNYLDLRDHHIVQPMSYYEDAMEVLDDKTDWYLVFSDDIEWCRGNFIGNNFIFVQDTDYVEMFLMSKCTNNIIANSSFSWWGAFLGDPNGRTVIAPKDWFPNNNPNASDIVPEYWIKL